MKRVTLKVGERDERFRKFLGWKVRANAGTTKQVEIDPSGRWAFCGDKAELWTNRDAALTTIAAHERQYPEDKGALKLVPVLRKESAARKALRELLDFYDRGSDGYVFASAIKGARKALEEK